MSKYLVELEDRPPASLEDLNRIFQSWVEQVYHRRVHTETGQAPLERFLAPGPPRLPTEPALTGAFRWSERRTVSKTGTVGMHGNTYEVDAELAGRQVDLVFDPLELAEVEVQYRRPARRAGGAAEDQTSRPPTRPAAASTPAEPTGIDYLGLIQKRREQELQKRIDYRNLPARRRRGRRQERQQGDDG